MFMGTTPPGKPVLINAMLMSHKGEDVFKAYLEKGAVNGHYDALKPTELPAGTDILDSVMVFRK